jgi:hypothetical protein
MKAPMARLAFATVAAALVLAATAPAYAAKLDRFAQCLSQRGATFFGAEWCPHCARQIDELGGSFRYVDYVECTVDEARCKEAGVRSYPTWTFADGSRLSGRLSLQHLARKTGCSLDDSASGGPSMIDVPRGGGAPIVELPGSGGVQIIEVP